MLEPSPPPPLPPPRFSLRTLLLAVTAAGVFFGLFWWFSPLVVVGWAMVALMIAAHVAGNSLGTNLRDRASKRRPPNDPDHTISVQQAPVSHLGERWSLGWGMLLPTATGGLAAMVGGCFWMEQVYHLGLDVYGLAVAAAAFGIIGGIASFAVATFSQVLAVAFWQALRHK